MNLERIPNDQKLHICKRYFNIGFFCLPLVWVLNSAWFFGEAFRKPEYEEQKQIKKYVVMSGIGAAIWIAAIATWVVVYQEYRASWGELGEKITYNLPLGRA